MKILTMEQYQAKGRRFHKMEKTFSKVLYASMIKKNASLRKEVFMETEYGRTRTVWYGFDNPSPGPLLIDLHGGGFILGSPEMDEKMNIEWSRILQCRIISIDYPKAPDQPFPAAVNQVYAIVEYLFDHAKVYGIDTKRIAIGGHSAGANLTTVTCMKAKKEGKIQPVCQFMNCPPLDLATTALEKPKPKGSIPPRLSFMFDSCYVNGHNGHDPYISPVYANDQDLKGLPPALIIVAGRDSLHNEGVRYYTRLSENGVDTQLLDYPTGRHCFMLKKSVITTDAFEKVTRFLQQHLQGTSAGEIR
ncbi:MAG: alpha/beta hydrolase [Bacteroidales bacterium]|nr:alpha/beta hydrolase [Bacteroidales bacterium]NLH23891.1 alpha/beta hydrolase [Bacteroidales bacterium]HPJ82440.1 alpha/beta hydrolase [Bacteroidales bacterium]